MKEKKKKVVDFLDFDTSYLSNWMSDWNRISSSGFCRPRITTYLIIKGILITDLANHATLKAVILKPVSKSGQDIKALY